MCQRQQQDQWLSIHQSLHKHRLCVKVQGNRSNGSAFSDRVKPWAILWLRWIYSTVVLRGKEVEDIDDEHKKEEVLDHEDNVIVIDDL